MADDNVEAQLILDGYRISHLYHLTHKDNLENILNNGLLSHNEAYQRNLNKIDISNNQVNQIRATKKDKIYDRAIHDYVPLYFNPHNSMFCALSRPKDIVVLALNRCLMLSEGVIFTDGNASNGPTKFFSSIDNLSCLNWSCINGDYWWTDKVFDNDGKRMVCAEVLVPSKIEIDSIEKIYSFDDDTLSVVSEKVKNFPNILVEKKGIVEVKGCALATSASSS